MNHPDSTEHQVQRAEELVSWTGHERLRFLWYRLRLTISEMNYASRRMVEVQMQLPSKWTTVPPPAPKRDLPVKSAGCRRRVDSPNPAISCLFCAGKPEGKCSDHSAELADNLFAYRGPRAIQRRARTDHRPSSDAIDVW